MNHKPHDLMAEFPQFAFKIHQLKTREPHFARLYTEYHEISRALQRAEAKIEPVDDIQMETLRKQRLKLKDELYAMLSN